MVNLFVFAANLALAGLAQCHVYKCRSDRSMPVSSDSEYACVIAFESVNGASDKFSVKVDVCKSPRNVHFYKLTEFANSAEKTELSYVFTRENNKYEQKVNGELYSIQVNLADVANISDVVDLSVIIGRGSKKTVMLRKRFPTTRDHCSWIETLSHSEKIAFIVCMCVLALLLFAILSIILGRCMRKNNPGEKYLFSPYAGREPVLTRVPAEDQDDERDRTTSDIKLIKQ